MSQMPLADAPPLGQHPQTRHLYAAWPDAHQPQLQKSRLRVFQGAGAQHQPHPPTEIAFLDHHYV